MKFTIAVMGATGTVGQEILRILAERNFPAKQVVPLASGKSQGREISFGNRVLKVIALEHYDFSETDICIIATGESLSKEWAPKITKTGCVIIDNSSAWRYHADVPLIVPEINPHAIVDFRKKNIIANPNCSTIQLLVPLKPLHDAATIERIVVSTYQSVSGAGKEAMDELFRQTRALLVGDQIEKEHFPKRIAFNLIPQIDLFMEDGTTKEEWKIIAETKKILSPAIKITATCVRVPVFIGHSESVNLTFQKDMSEETARKILRKTPGCVVIDKREDAGYITPIECVGEDAIYISRIREDISVEHGLNMWIVSDNLRKGAALNAIQIAELLIKEKHIIPKNST